MALAAAESRKFRSGALSKTASPSSRITASWTTAVGERVWRRPLSLHHPGRNEAQLLVYPRDNFPAGAMIPLPQPREDDREFGTRQASHPASENP